MSGSDARCASICAFISARFLRMSAACSFVSLSVLIAASIRDSIFVCARVSCFARISFFCSAKNDRNSSALMWNRSAILSMMGNSFGVMRASIVAAPVMAVLAAVAAIIPVCRICICVWLDDIF